MGRPLNLAACLVLKVCDPRGDDARASLEAGLPYNDSRRRHRAQFLDPAEQLRAGFEAASVDASVRPWEPNLEDVFVVATRSREPCFS